MTPRQQDVLRAVKRHLRAYRCAPTRAELGRELGVSRPTVEQHLQALRGQGALVLRREWRGIYLTTTKGVTP